MRRTAVDLCARVSMRVKGERSENFGTKIPNQSEKGIFYLSTRETTIRRPSALQTSQKKICRFTIHSFHSNAHSLSVGEAKEVRFA
jgi:hypothetical protein